MRQHLSQSIELEFSQLGWEAASPNDFPISGLSELRLQEWAGCLACSMGPGTQTPVLIIAKQGLSTTEPSLQLPSGPFKSFLKATVTITETESLCDLVVPILVTPTGRRAP